MNILLPLSGTDRGISGIGRYVHSVVPPLASAVDALGGRLIASGTPRDFDAYPGVPGSVEKHVLPKSLDHPGLSALWHLGLLQSRARQLGADVVLLPAANRRICGTSRVPTVGVVHDLAQQHVAGKYDVSRMLYFRFGLLRAINKLSHVVAVSESTASDLRTCVNTDRTGISVVPNGVDVTLFTRRSDDQPEKEAPYILYVSRLEHPGKNHVRLLRAYAKSRLPNNYRLVFAGADAGGRTRIQQEIAALGVEANVDLLDYVPDTTLRGLIVNARATVMVGLHEGFGLPALESLACGVPVLASRTGALPEVVADLGQFCDPKSPESIRNALEQLVLDDRLHVRVKTDGPKRARRFSWGRTAESLVQCCKETLDSSRSASRQTGPISHSH